MSINYQELLKQRNVGDSDLAGWTILVADILDIVKNGHRPYLDKKVEFIQEKIEKWELELSEGVEDNVRRSHLREYIWKLEDLCSFLKEELSKEEFIKKYGEEAFDRILDSHNLTWFFKWHWTYGKKIVDVRFFKPELDDEPLREQDKK